MGVWTYVELVFGWTYLVFVDLCRVWPYVGINGVRHGQLLGIWSSSMVLFPGPESQRLPRKTQKLVFISSTPPGTCFSLVQSGPSHCFPLGPVVLLANFNCDPFRLSADNCRIISPGPSNQIRAEFFLRREGCNMAYHCGHFTMDNYLWTFTCEYFTLLHVVLSVHFTLFHVVSFDQSLTAFRLLCQLTHQPVHTRVVAHLANTCLAIAHPAYTCPTRTATVARHVNKTSSRDASRCIAHTLGTLLFILRTYVETRPIQTVALYVFRQSIPGVYPFHCNDRRVVTVVSAEFDQDVWWSW
jgi:hypothetical protein